MFNFRYCGIFCSSPVSYNQYNNRISLSDNLNNHKDYTLYIGGIMASKKKKKKKEHKENAGKQKGKNKYSFGSKIP